MTANTARQIFCTDCKHCEQIQSYWCNRPTGNISLVDGKPIRLLSKCKDERHGITKEKCGYVGRFFEEKERVNLTSTKTGVLGWLCNIWRRNK